MNLLRAAFWLALAFIMVHPAGIDPQSMAQAGQSLGTQTLSAGRGLAQTALKDVPCTSLECTGAKAIASAALGPATATVAKPATPEAGGAIPYPAPPLQRKG